MTVVLNPKSSEFRYFVSYNFSRCAPRTVTTFVVVHLGHGIVIRVSLLFLFKTLFFWLGMELLKRLGASEHTHGALLPHCLYY